MVYRWFKKITDDHIMVVNINASPRGIFLDILEEDYFRDGWPMALVTYQPGHLNIYDIRDPEFILPAW